MCNKFVKLGKDFMLTLYNVTLQYTCLSWLMNERTFSFVKPKPRNVRVQRGVKTQTPTVRAPPRSIRENGGNSQRPSLLSNFRGSASLCRKGSSRNGRGERRLCPPLSPVPPRMLCTPEPACPPRCSPKAARKPRKEIQYGRFIYSRLNGI
jgi:hypothetical protein